MPDPRRCQQRRIRSQCYSLILSILSASLLSHNPVDVPVAASRVLLKPIPALRDAVDGDARVLPLAFEEHLDLLTTLVPVDRGYDSR